MNSLAAQTRLILRNDLRLLWRDLKAGRAGAWANGALIGVLFAVANIIAITVCFIFHRQPAIGYETLAWFFFGFVMLSAAMNQAISVLFERSDFDLLLSSPVSPRAILLARTATMSVGAASSAALLLLPLLNGALLAISPRYAAGYLVWLLLSCAVASAGVWFTLLLVKWLGPRRARTWAQVVAALLGAGIYLLMQGQNFLPIDERGKFLAAMTSVLSHPVLAFVARAGRGELLPLLALAVIAAAFVALTTRVLARMFIGGVQEGGAITPERKPSHARRHVFTEGVARATFLKDVRLIVRDPLLLAQVLPSALYILPAVFGMAQFAGVTLLGPVSLVIAVQFSTALTAVSTAGEECWDLIRMSPTPELRLRLAKLAAGMALPAGVSFVLCTVLAILGHPWLGLLGLVYSLACGAAAAWLQVTRIKPTPRRDVMKRGGQNRSGSFIALFITMVGAVGLGVAGTTHWIAATVLLGVTALLVLACFVLNGMTEINSREFSPASPGSE